MAVSLANGFVERGYEVTFFADLYEEQTYALNDDVQVQNLVCQSTNKLKKWFGAIWVLRKQLKKDKPDALIGIMSLCSIIAKIASIGMGIPIIATEHNSYERPISAPLPLFIKLYKFYICKFFSCVTVLTEVDRRVISNRIKNVVVMPNPLAIAPLEKMFDKKKTILAAGRLDNWHVKGFDVLIRAWGHVIDRLNVACRVEIEKRKELTLVEGESTDAMIPKTINQNSSANLLADWKLVIAGVWRNPETRAYLDGIAKECGVFDRIEYTGFVENMQKLYSESSIFVLSSRYEGFGLVLVEAMSQGCACVACDYKGRQREIISPTPALPSREGEECKGIEVCDNGILCQPDNVEALADAMAKMIMDDEYRESVRKNAIERSKYYSIDNIIDRWESLLKQVTKTC